MTKFKQDEMTEKERFEALLLRKPIDRVPFFPYDFAFAPVMLGYSKFIGYTDADKGFDAIVRTHEMFDGCNYAFHPGGAFPARVFGGEVKIPTSEYAMAVALERPAVETEEAAWKLQLPDIRTRGAIPLMMRFSELQYKYGYPISFTSGSILTRLGYIIGVEKMCRWMLRKPELVHRLCQLVVDFLVSVAEYWVDTFKHPELMIPLTGAPTDSNQIISSKQFAEFCLPYQKEVYQKLRDMGIRHIFTHICGEQNLNLPYWAQIPMGDPGIVSFGHEVDLDTASKYFPNDVIMGNVEPAVIQTGKPEAVYELSRICIEKGKKHPSGFILSSGCDMPPHSPPYNVWMMRKAIDDFGWYI